MTQKTHPLSNHIQRIVANSKPEFLMEDLCKLLDVPQTMTNKAMIFEKDGAKFIVGWKNGERYLEVETGSELGD